MNMQTVLKILKKNFNFLYKEYGFFEIDNIVDKRYCIIKMKNKTTGIAYQYELRENDIYVYLYRLIDEKMVEDKTPISNFTPLNSVELRFIVQFFEGEASINKYSKQSFDKSVQDIAADLKKYCDSVLKGDFNIFNQVDAIAKKRRLEWQNS